MSYKIRFNVFDLLMLILCFNVASSASIFEWFDWNNYENLFSFSQGKNDQQSSPKPEHVNLREGVTLISVPFEELSPEDKFLEEAGRFNGVTLSGIDSCEHRAVIKIQNSCSNINEEELAKLSIGLLNCQLEISDRPQIKCTDEMTLKECTAPMDSETWNAYHTINNRARAVCYATRQVQFRALSEMTVNKLMSSALQQLKTMDNIEELQKELTKLTTDTVDSLKEGQQGLMDQNSGLRLATSQVQNHIVANLKQLTQEKTIIQSMQHQLKTLSEKLSQELGDVGSQLESQSEQHQTIHQEIVSKLDEISVKADAIWNVIDERSRKLHKQQEQITKSTMETMENLKKINTTVNDLLGMVNQVKKEVDEKVSLLTEAIGGDGQVLMSVAQHSLLLVAGVLVSLFLQLNIVCRFILLVAVVASVSFYHLQPLNLLYFAGAIISWWILVVLTLICWSHIKKSKGKEIPKRDENENNDDNLSPKSSSQTALSSQDSLTTQDGDIEKEYPKRDDNENNYDILSPRSSSQAGSLSTQDGKEIPKLDENENNDDNLSPKSSSQTDSLTQDGDIGKEYPKQDENENNDDNLFPRTSFRAGTLSAWDGNSREEVFAFGGDNVPVPGLDASCPRITTSSEKELPKQDGNENNKENVSPRTSSQAGNLFTLGGCIREDLSGDLVRRRWCGVMCRNSQLCYRELVPKLGTCRRHITASADKEFPKRDEKKNNDDNLSPRSSFQEGNLSMQGGRIREDMVSEVVRHQRCGVACSGGQTCSSIPAPGLKTCRQHIPASTGKEFPKQDENKKNDVNLSPRSLSQAGSLPTQGEPIRENVVNSSVRYRLCGVVCRDGHLCRSRPAPWMGTCRQHILFPVKDRRCGMLTRRDKPCGSMPAPGKGTCQQHTIGFYEGHRRCGMLRRDGQLCSRRPDKGLGTCLAHITYSETDRRCGVVCRSGRLCASLPVPGLGMCRIHAQT